MIFYLFFHRVKLNKYFFGTLNVIVVLTIFMSMAVAGEIYYCNDRPHETGRSVSCPDSYIYRLGKPAYGQEKNNSLPTEPDRQVLAFIYGQLGKPMPEYCRIINNPLCLQAAEEFTQKYRTGSMVPEDEVLLIKSADEEYLYKTHRHLSQAYTSSCPGCRHLDNLLLSLLVGYVVWGLHGLWVGEAAAFTVSMLLFVIEVNYQLRYPTPAARKKAEMEWQRDFIAEVVPILKAIFWWGVSCFWYGVQFY